MTKLLDIKGNKLHIVDGAPTLKNEAMAKAYTLPKSVQIATDVASMAYNYAPFADRDDSKKMGGAQAAIVSAALRKQGVCQYATVPLCKDGTAAGRISDCYSYLGKSFAGVKGFGLHFAFMTLKQHLASFGPKERKAEHEAIKQGMANAGIGRSAATALIDAPAEQVLVQVFYAYDKQGNGKAPAK